MSSPVPPWDDPQSNTHYFNPPIGLDPVFKRIARTKIGAVVLEKFLPLLAQRKIQFHPYPTALLEKLRKCKEEESLSCAEPIGACLVMNSHKKGEIYYDATSPFGILIPLLFHEICHAIDGRFWREGKTLTSEEVVLTEMDAFEKHYLLIEELRAKDSAYDYFLKQSYPNSKLLHQKFSRAEIESMYLPTENQTAA